RACPANAHDADTGLANTHDADAHPTTAVIGTVGSWHRGPPGGHHGAATPQGRPASLFFATSLHKRQFAPARVRVLSLNADRGTSGSHLISATHASPIPSRLGYGVLP